MLEKQLAAIRLQQENANTLKAEEARLMEEEKKQREAENKHLLQVAAASFSYLYKLIFVYLSKPNNIAINDYILQNSLS